MPAKILIITNGALCRNPRALKEAMTLAEAGHAVTVLTVRNHASSEDTDRVIMQSAPFRRVTVDMLPGPDRNGLQVACRRLRLRLARDLAVRTGWTSIHALGPAVALLNAARRQPADLTIVHNEVPHWVGTRLLTDGRRVAADIEDWHSEDLLPQDRRGRPLKLLRRIERTLLHDAIHTTTTSEALSTALHERYAGRRPEVITNSFPLQRDPRAGEPGSPPAFFWFSQTLGPGRGLEDFLAAWARTTKPSHLVLVGESQADYQAKLLAVLPAAFSARVSVRPLVAPAALPTLIAQHDIGLALELAAIPNRDLTIPNKILQYLNAGLMVVATPTQGQREVLNHAPAAGLLANLEDPIRLAADLDAVLGDRVALAARQQTARLLASSRYCWERETPRLLALVETALNSDPLR